MYQAADPCCGIALWPQNTRAFSAARALPTARPVQVRAAVDEDYVAVLTEGGMAIIIEPNLGSRAPRLDIFILVAADSVARFAARNA